MIMKLVMLTRTMKKLVSLMEIKNKKSKRDTYDDMNGLGPETNEIRTNEEGDETEENYTF